MKTLEYDKAKFREFLVSLQGEDELPGFDEEFPTTTCLVAQGLEHTTGETVSSCGVATVVVGERERELLPEELKLLVLWFDRNLYRTNYNCYKRRGNFAEALSIFDACFP